MDRGFSLLKGYTDLTLWGLFRVAREDPSLKRAEKGGILCIFEIFLGRGRPLTHKKERSFLVTQSSVHMVLGRYKNFNIVIALIFGMGLKTVFFPPTPYSEISYIRSLSAHHPPRVLEPLTDLDWRFENTFFKSFKRMHTSNFFYDIILFPVPY